jgi:hypothetical protein
MGIPADAEAPARRNQEKRSGLSWKIAANSCADIVEIIFWMPTALVVMDAFEELLA